MQRVQVRINNVRLQIDPSQTEDEVKVKSTHNSDNQDYFCPICGQSVKGLNNLNNHVDLCLQTGSPSTENKPLGSSENFKDNYANQDKENIENEGNIEEQVSEAD